VRFDVATPIRVDFHLLGRQITEQLRDRLVVIGQLSNNAEEPDPEQLGFSSDLSVGLTNGEVSNARTK
jgi:hypothetical protein